MVKRPQELDGINISELARICRVSERTARRWKNGTMCPPETALMVLRICWLGDLSDLGPEWAGWQYRDGKLTSPDGWTIERNDALAVPLLHGQISALRGKIAELEAVSDEFEDQPEPGT